MNRPTNTLTSLRGLSAVWALVFAVILAACTSTQSPAPPTTVPATSPLKSSSTSSTSAPSRVTTEPSMVTTPAVSFPTRDCATKTGGLVPFDEMTTEFVENSVRAGPVLFGNAATFGEITVENLAPATDHRYPAIKVPLAVAAGETVTIEIAPSSQTWASLLYDIAAFSGGNYALSDGTPAASFTACAEGDTSFNGGIIVASPGCLELLVTNSDQPLPVAFAVGPAEC